ncbi:hypothetical protein OG21DRAFT_255033 [Imleria badia]|nr:hypothetical protein OG21DRAFT_255033 [Imleria badia]
MEDWWSNNVQELASLGMNLANHACVTTVRDCHELPLRFASVSFIPARFPRLGSWELPSTTTPG